LAKFRKNFSQISQNYEIEILRDFISRNFREHPSFDPFPSIEEHKGNILSVQHLSVIDAKKLSISHEAPKKETKI